MRFDPDVVARFWRGVMIAGPDDCWNWRGAIRPWYGRFWVRRGEKRLGTHVVSYLIHHGSIPVGMEVCHKCDNKRCVNPKHLFLGTHATNCADCARKGGMSVPKPHGRGSRNHQALLSESEVLEIRASTATGKELARRYGVHHSTVYKARSGVNWKHVA